MVLLKDESEGDRSKDNILKVSKQMQKLKIAKQHSFPDMTHLIYILNQTYQELSEHANQQLTKISI